MASTHKYQAAGEARYRVKWRCRGCKDHPNGGQHSKSFNRQKDAQVFENEKTREELAGDVIEIQDKKDIPSFGEFAGLTIENGKVVLIEGAGWFARYKGTVRASSYKRRVEANVHLAELIPMRIDRVNAQVVEDILTTIGAASRQADYALMTIKMILRNARMRGWPVDEKVLTRPKDGGLKTAKNTNPKPKVFLTKTQVDALAEVSGFPELIRFTVMTGLRRIEVFGLTDQHVVRRDGKAVAIHITRDITKSDAGVRTIPLTKQARELLLSAMLKRKAGSTFIFPGKRGGAMWKNSLYEYVRVWRTELHDDAIRLGKLPPETQTVWSRFTFHDLRHTFASWQINANINPKTLQRLMGHENWSVTMDTYAHLFPEATQDAMDCFEQYLERPEVSSGEDTGTEEAASR